MSVHFMFTGDNKDLLKKAQESRKEILEIDKQAKETSRSMETSFGSMGAAIAAFFTAQQASAIINRIIEVRGEFQKFKAVLSNTLGSDQEAQSAMDMLTNFASKTPFQVNELTASFVKLANQGFTPAYDEMMKLGDLASSTGKGFDQLAEAIIDAQTGEMERLKEFGIRASKDGDKVTFTFKEQQTTVDNSAKAIREYILSLGAMEGVTGANAKIAATLTGQVSNLEDSITSMYNKIGQQHEGILSDAVGGAASLVENYEEVGAALAALIVSYGAYKAVTLGLVAMERSQANIKYTQEAAELAKLLPIKEAAINADISAAVAKGTLTTAQAEGIMSLRAESAANLQALQAVAAKAAAEKIAAKAVYESSLARELASKQMVIQRREELTAIIATGNAEQIAAAKGALASAKTEEHIAVKGRKIAADNLSVASTNAESTAKAVNDVTTKAGTVSDIQATKAKGLLAIATKGLAAAFNMIKGPLIIAAIAGIAYAVYKLITADTAAEKAQKKLNEEREKAVQLKQQMTSEADGLIAKINNETETIYAQIKAYDELIKRFPELKGLSFEEFKGMPQDKQKKMIGGILDEQELKNAEKAYEESLKRVEEIKKKISDISTGSQGRTSIGKLNKESEESKLEASLILLKGHEEELEKIKELQWKANTPVEEQIKHYEAIQAKLKEELDALNKLQNPNKALLSYTDSMVCYWLDTKDIIGSITLNSLNKQIEDTRDKLKGLRGEEESGVKNKSYWEKKKKTAEDNLGKLPDSDIGSKEWNGYLAEIQKAEKALAKYNVSTSKDATSRLKAQQELSRSILENELKLQSSRIAIMQDGKDKRVLLADQEYKETLASIEKERAEYKKGVKDTGGKEDSSVLATFDNQKTTAKDKRNTDVANINKESVKEFADHQKQLSEILLSEEGKRLSSIKDRYDKEREWANDQLKGGGMSEEQYVSYTAQIDTSEAQDNLKSLLDKYQNYDAKRLELDRNYTAEIATLTAQRTEANKTEVDTAIAEAQKRHKEESAALNFDEFKGTDLWKKMFGDLDKMAIPTLQNILDKAKEVNTSTWSPENIKEYQDAITRLEESVRTRSPFKSIESDWKKLLKAINTEDGSTDENGKTFNKRDAVAGALADIDQAVQKVNADLKTIAGGIGDIFGDEAGYAAEQVTELTSALGGFVSAASKFASGDILGGIAGVVSSIGSIFSMGKKNKEMNREAREENQKFYDEAKAGEIEYQAMLRERLRITQQIGETSLQYFERLQKELDKQKGDVGKQYEDVWSKLMGEEYVSGKGYKHGTWFRKAKTWDEYGSLTGKSYEDIESLYTQGKLTDSAKVLFEQLQKLKDEGADVVGMMDDLNQSMKEAWTGTTEDSIAQSIIDGIAAGKDGVDDLTTYFRDMMKKAMLQGVNMKYLQEPIKKFYEQFADMSESGGMLTEDEIKQLEEMYQNIVNNAKAQFDNLQKVSGLDFSKDETSDNSLKGAYAKASEESITLLAGQAGAQRVVMEDIKNNMQPIREQLQFIRDLQTKGWEDVKAIRDLTDKVEKNTGKIAEIAEKIDGSMSEIGKDTRRSADALDGGTINAKVKM